MNEKYSYEFVNHFSNMPLYYAVIGVDEFTFHWHSDIEVLFALKGTLCVNFGNSRYLMKKGDVLLINSNQPHYFEDIGEDNLVLLIQFSPEIINNVTGNRKRKIFFECNTMTAGTMQEEAFEKLRILLANIGYEIYKERNGFEFYIISKFYEVVGMLYRHFKYTVAFDETKSSDDKNLERVKVIIDYIECNYSEDISLSDVAKAVHMSDSYFSHCLKDIIGISFKQYLDLVRFHKSAELLRTTEQSVIDIAVACGFNNKQPMYRLYKKNIGMTPSEYREKKSKTNRKNITLINNYRIVNPTDAIKYFVEYIK